MNRDDIIKLAGHREVPPWVMKLVMDCVEAERESCAKVCDEVRDVIGRSGDVVDKPDCWCAAAIRARSEQ